MSHLHILRWSYETDKFQNDFINRQNFNEFYHT